jgi:hypothetical protein
LDLEGNAKIEKENQSSRHGGSSRIDVGATDA